MSSRHPISLLRLVMRAVELNPSPQAVLLLHHATAHGELQKLKHSSKRVKGDTARHLSNVHDDLVRERLGAEKSSRKITHKRIESILIVSCEKIIKGETPKIIVHSRVEGTNQVL